MTTASSSTVVADRVSPLATDTAILEKQLRFSKMPHKVLRYAGGLGLFNLGLVGVAATVVANTSSNMVLRRVRRGEWVVVCLSPFSHHHRSTLIATWLLQVFPFLAVYGLLYNVIPLTRYLSLRSKNSQINDRNARREAW